MPPGTAGGGATSAEAVAEWLRLQDQDIPYDEPAGPPMAASTDEELEACKEECLELGYGGFVVRKGTATFRPQSREDCLMQRSPAGYWNRGCVLHIVPPVQEGMPTDVQVSFGSNVGFRTLSSTLASKSEYFASLFRHAWADGKGEHSFSEFPGEEPGFHLAMTWLGTPRNYAVPRPWPLETLEEVQLAIEAAAYLGAPRLLYAAVRSWRLSGHRNATELLQAATAIGAACSQFEGEDQGVIIKELQALLHTIPRHSLRFMPQFLESPRGGLVMLEARQSVQQTLVGQFFSVVASKLGNMANGSAGSGDRGGASGGICSEEEAPTPHAFAVRLFAAHEAFFLSDLPALRQLLSYVDKSPIPPPLCFRLAAAAVAAATESGGEVFAGHRLAIDIFEQSLCSVADPAQSASDEACIVGLFGAGSRAGPGGSAQQPPMQLDVLGRPLVPPSAAAVVLSRVLSSWAAGEASQDGADAADVILRGVASNRQGLRSLLERVLPLISAEGGSEMGTEWGNSFDYAVPELRAAFAQAAGGKASADELDESTRLLFRVVFQPSGGLPGTAFPLGLLRELRSHSAACQVLAAQHALAELRRRAAERAGHPWAAAEEVWPSLAWDVVEQALVSNAVETLRQWLAESWALPAMERDKAEVVSVRLFKQLPLDTLDDPEEALGPPVPAHVLAGVAYRKMRSFQEELEVVKAENTFLRNELSRLNASNPSRPA